MKGIRKLFRGVQKPEDSLRCSHGRLHDIVLLGQISYGLKKTPHILEERHQHPGKEVSLNHPPSTVPDHEAKGTRRKDLHAGEKKGAEEDGTKMLITGLLVHPIEPAEILLFSPEKLDRGHPGDEVLLEKGIEPCQVAPHPTVSIPRLDPVEGCDQ